MSFNIKKYLLVVDISKLFYTLIFSRLAMIYRTQLSLLALFCLAFLSAACGEMTTGSAAIQDGSYEVAPLFHEFYAELGGSETMGAAISPLFTFNSASYQYTVAGLMGHDPDAPPNQRFYLAALGLDMGIIEPGISPPDHPNMRYIGGHIIYDVFVPWYEQFGGTRIVGQPITEVHYNPVLGRYEQYFENLGFYYSEGELMDAVQLLPYGWWKCGNSCNYNHDEQITIDVPYPAGEPFKEAVSRLGPDFTGAAISEVYTNSAGDLEQVFGNIVLVQDSEQAGKVSLRPIAENLGIKVDSLAFPSKDPGMVFIPINDNQGYNVPGAFLDYLALHGGVAAAGPPVNEFTPLNNDVYRQCFENICLEEHRDEQSSWRVRPVPLGYAYLEQGRGSVAPSAIEPASHPDQSDLQDTRLQPDEDKTSYQAEDIRLDVWERHPTVAQNQAQEITVSVFRDNVPVSLVEPLLVITLPDDKSKSYYMLPTGEDGTSYLKLDPVDVENGTLIPYQVCIYDFDEAEKCVEDSFMVWGDL